MLPAALRCSLPRTEQSNYAAGPRDDAHGADILLAEGVLDTGNDRTDGRRLDRRTRSVGERIHWVVGGCLVGHGGRNWRIWSSASSQMSTMGNEVVSALAQKHAIPQRCVVHHRPQPPAGARLCRRKKTTSFTTYTWTLCVPTMRVGCHTPSLPSTSSLPRQARDRP